MHTPEMHTQQRAIRALLVCGAWLFPASAATASAAEATPRWLRPLRDSGLLDALEEPLLGRYREWLADSHALQRFQEFATSSDGALTLMGLALLCVAAALAARRLRPTGRLTLRLDFPDEIDGDFEIQLHRRSQRKARASGQRSAAPHTRKSVQRETQFDRVGPGVWFVSVEGELRARESGALLGEISDELPATIEAKQSRTIDHALDAVEAPVEFRIHWDRQPAREFGLRLADQPQTLRYAGQGNVHTTLPLGAHRLVIGAGDRVVERSVEILGYEPSLIQIDLAEPDGLVFKGCPPAVPLFLQGDIGGAARALERDGHADVAALLLAQLHQEQGQPERAAEHLEHAGHTREAAELRRSISDFDRAALLFEDAGDRRRAAEMWEAAESWAEAAAAYAALEAWADAARCYERAEDTDGLVGALEAQGELLRAAALASESDDRARAIRLLQQVGPQDPEFGRANELLALAFEQEGHLDLAADQLTRRLESLRPDEPAAQLELHLAELLEETGEYTGALTVLETLRAREPTHPGVGARIEGLRKKLSGLVAARGRDTAPVFDPPSGATAFVAEERYEVLGEVGRGGMGVVYKARDRRLGRVVALKRMPESLRDHPAAIQLFLGEAQAAARMNHPNIVTLYDADQESGSFFITMELLEGLPLNRILEERGAFGPRDTARIGLQVCAGLQYAHEQSIVHRDIKTSNLFITKERVLKIMDFGLAKILEAVRDKGASVIAGTPYYMAPEQAAGKVNDGRTDLYALGVTLFELSTGRLPFREGDVAAQHREAPAPDPSLGIDGYPPALAQLIQRMMCKAPEDRPATASAVAEMLGTILRSG